MNKKKLSERDICTKFITPAVVKAGWDLNNQLREEVYFTNGRVIIRSDNKAARGDKKRADYILYYKSTIPIAIIEAKDNNHPLGAGLPQAMEYGTILDIPFTFSSNGDGFIEHDRTGMSNYVEKEFHLDQFPSPAQLWSRYKKWKGIEEKHEIILTQEYYSDFNAKKPRYYQEIAINRTIEAITKGRNRILLVMATGTGKTFVASQIIYRLWKSKAKKRILYLSDRNILVDYPMNNDFKIFKKVMTKVTNRTVDKSYEVYMALYQGVSGKEEQRNIYKQFSRDFFDLIIVDECHRGSADENSAWREILEYFTNAAQIGLTATPKETKEISNIDYFGEPVYTYSLRQGIDDGFLAPYRVIRISLDKDVEGWRPTRGEKDKYGYEVPDRIYNQKDYDRDLVIDPRRLIVAKKISEYMKNTDPVGKTIVFCTDIEHADGMRTALANENADQMKKNPKYVVKITGEDPAARIELDNFIDPSKKYPVIATTSKLLNTGVDIQTCKLVVLDANIQSMTEFKQIIGRGTRIREDYGKFFFTIMDFRQATNLFADPNFDGEPVQIYEPNLDEEVRPPEVNEDPTKYANAQEQVYILDEEAAPRKYYVNDVEVSVLNERIQYYDREGKLITESLKDYTRKNIRKEYSSLTKFLTVWKESDKKTAVIEEMVNQGILLNELKSEVGKEFDEFDLICHVAFDKKPLTRRERAQNVRKRNYFTKYGDKAKKVIDSLLDKYADEGIENIEDIKVLSVNPLAQYGTPIEIVAAFGGKKQYREAVRELESLIYA